MAQLSPFQKLPSQMERGGWEVTPSLTFSPHLGVCALGNHHTYARGGGPQPPGVLWVLTGSELDGAWAPTAFCFPVSQGRKLRPRAQG